MVRKVSGQAIELVMAIRVFSNYSDSCFSLCRYRCLRITVIAAAMVLCKFRASKFESGERTDEHNVGHRRNPKGNMSIASIKIIQRHHHLILH